MKRKRHSPDQIIRRVHEADVTLLQGQLIAQVSLPPWASKEWSSISLADGIWSGLRGNCIETWPLGITAPKDARLAAIANKEMAPKGRWVGCGSNLDRRIETPSMAVI